jgi:hypothetical protein
MKASTLANIFLDATTLTSAEAEVGKMAKAGKGFKAGKAKMSQDVCIIGGGPSGLTAALRLHDKGYKHITIFEKAQDTPACYALQLNPPQVVAGFLTQGPTPLYMADYASLFIRAAADSGADIQLNAVITNIDYHHDNSVKSVKYVQKGKSGKSQTKKCDQLIHAIPYNLEEDGRFGFDQEQQAVLHDIIVEPFYTSYVKMTELKFGERYYPLIHGESNSFGEFKGVGEPISGFKQDNLTRYTNVYSWHRNPKPADFSTAQVKGLVNQYLEFLCLDRDEAGECTPLEVEAIFPWRYFAHVNSSSIQAGWFTRLEDLQGQRNTYFTGSARSFEIIEMVVRSAYDIVDRFF